MLLHGPHAGLAERVLQQREEGRLAGAGGADDDDAHPLRQLLVQLDRLLDLQAIV